MTTVNTLIDRVRGVGAFPLHHYTPERVTAWAAAGGLIPVLHQTMCTPLGTRHAGALGRYVVGTSFLAVFQKA